MKTIELLRFRLSLIVCLSAFLGLAAQTSAQTPALPSGVVYFGEGGLGVRQRTPKKDRWYLQKPGMADRGHHVQLLTFTPDELQYRCVLLGGEVLDRHVLAPRR